MNERAPTRAQQAEWRRIQLLDTALEVFAAKGLAGTTIKDLAEGAGVAPGLLYHYFRSKEDLFRAVLERHYFLPELRRITAPDREGPVAEVLLEVATSFAAMLRTRRPLLQVVVREAPVNPTVAERVAQAQRESVQLLGDYLASRVAAGELRPHDTSVTARLLLFAVVTSQLTDTQPDDFLPKVVETIVYGIVAH